MLVTGMGQGPAGQWVRFEFVDLSKDVDGRFTDHFKPAEGDGSAADTLSLSYGSNGLLPKEHREEFRERLEPFKDLTTPEPLES